MLNKKIIKYFPTIIAVIMLSLTVALIFIPFRIQYQNIPQVASIYRNSILYYFETIELWNTYPYYFGSGTTLQMLNERLLPTFIISIVGACVFVILGIFAVIFSRKKPLINVVFCINFSTFIGFALYSTISLNKMEFSFIPYIGFYLALFALLFLIAYFVLATLKKHGKLKPLPRREPHSHNPTNAERIAELENQVAQLIANRKSVD